MIVRSILLILTLLLHSVSFAETVIMAVDHYPPWKITNEGKPHGIDIDLFRAVAREMNLEIEFRHCPWSRCLHMIATGEADILSGVLKRPEREAFMRFTDIPYKTRSTKAFFIRARDGITIKRYGDLDGLTIGILRNSQYFARFDNDRTIAKELVNDNTHSFRKLSRGRIDAVIITESTGDHYVRTLGLEKEIAKAHFRHDDFVPVHFAVSKNSPLIRRMDELNNIVRTLRNEGVFGRIIRTKLGFGR